eukprot:4758640-Alexandrium_andersonii.AAC.1
MPPDRRAEPEAEPGCSDEVNQLNATCWRYPHWVCFLGPNGVGYCLGSAAQASARPRGSHINSRWTRGLLVWGRLPTL